MTGSAWREGIEDALADAPAGARPLVAYADEAELEELDALLGAGDPAALTRAEEVVGRLRRRARAGGRP